MTKAEALNTLMKMRAWRAWGKEQKEEERPEMPEQKEVDEAFDVCIKLLQKQPSLPSDLDEAAKSYTNDSLNNLGAILRVNVINAFKAGAEWMAGQGVTVDGVLKAGDPGYPDVHMGEQYSIEYILRKPNGIEPGDEVIAQIRKKQ